MQVCEVNALQKPGRNFRLVSCENLGEHLEFVCDVYLLGHKVVLGLRRPCVGSILLVVTHAHLALKLARQSAVFSLRAETSGEDYLYEEGCQAKCAHLGSLRQDFGIAFGVRVPINDRLHDCEQVAESVFAQKIEKPFFLQLFQLIACCVELVLSLSLQPFVVFDFKFLPKVNFATDHFDELLVADLADLKTFVDDLTLPAADLPLGVRHLVSKTVERLVGKRLR